MIADLKVDLDPRENVNPDRVSYHTPLPNVFAAGDLRRGQSVVVWACPAKAARPRTRSTGP
jgi:glutamate synthase (NADPH/NADH) small chain